MISARPMAMLCAAFLALGVTGLRISFGVRLRCEGSKIWMTREIGVRDLDLGYLEFRVKRQGVEMEGRERDAYAGGDACAWRATPAYGRAEGCALPQAGLSQH